MMINKAYKFRIYSNKTQATLIAESEKNVIHSSHFQQLGSVNIDY
ncbi:hypothetical protein MC28_G031 (plasmid) [Bacillus thuringiensis MC28]|nr:hypothetical protein MC28_G031 [Bacillus thuringiensis MC28]